MKVDVMRMRGRAKFYNINDSACLCLTVVPGDVVTLVLRPDRPSKVYLSVDGVVYDERDSELPF